VSRLDPKGDNYLSFRSGPGGQPYEELDRLGPNTPATVLTQKGKWSKIRLLDGRVGWAHSNYLARGYAEQNTASAPRQHAQEKAGFRQSPPRDTGNNSGSNFNASSASVGVDAKQASKGEIEPTSPARAHQPPAGTSASVPSAIDQSFHKADPRAAIASGSRFALVIGVDAYESVPQLQKAVNDSRTMSSVLRGLGFDVISGENLSRAELSRKLIEFESRLTPGDTALFFFAGHGFEIRGQNFLLPADVPAVAEGQEELIKDSSFAADRIIDRMRDRGAKTVIAVLDACRNNPFERLGGRSITGTRGLAQMTPAEGVFVVFSAGAKQEAIDRLSNDDQAPNSVFTRVFQKQLAVPGLPLDQIVKRTRLEVRDLARTIGREQTPAYYDQIIGDVVLKPAE